MKSNFKQICVTIDENTYKKLKEDAKQSLCSMSFIIRDALREYYQNKENNKRRVK